MFTRGILHLFSVPQCIVRQPDFSCSPSCDHPLLGIALERGHGSHPRGSTRGGQPEWPDNALPAQYSLPRSSRLLPVSPHFLIFDIINVNWIHKLDFFVTDLSKQPQERFVQKSPSKITFGLRLCMWSSGNSSSTLMQELHLLRQLAGARHDTLRSNQ